MPSHSKRLDLIPPYLFAEIARIKSEMRQKGEDIIDLGIGDPDLQTPNSIVSAMQSAVTFPETHRYDESARGLPEFLDAAKRWYQRNFDVNLDPATEMLEVIGSKEGLAHLVWAFADPGDAVIVPDPGYPVYRLHASMAGAEVFGTPLNEGNSFLPNLAEIPTEVAKKAKLFFTCYPSNPTGAIATPNFYEEITAFCKEFDIIHVADLAYSMVTFDGYKSPSPLQIPEAKELTIEFHSLSKPFNMTGWRIGFACGSSYAISALSKLKDNIDSKQFAAVAKAAAFALNEVDNSKTMTIYQNRRNALIAGLANAGWNIEPPKATFYVWAKIPTEETSAEFAKRMLQEAKVLMIPGNGYGPNGEGYVRMSLTVSGDKNGEKVAEAAERIGNVLRKQLSIS